MNRGRLLPLPLLLLGCWPEPDLSRAPALDRPPVPMPVLIAPAGDRELQAVFVDDRDPAKVELTFVWQDEDNPIAVFDLAYDGWRWIQMHRVADVETSYIRRDPTTGAPLALVLPTTFAGDQRWDVIIARHLAADVPWNDLQRDLDGRPRVWVTTWNHLLTYRQPAWEAPAGPWRELRDLPLRRGSRADCQALYEATWRASPFGRLPR